MKRAVPFVFGEVVVVRSGPADILSQEGVVRGFCPTQDETDWDVDVWLPAKEEVWTLHESQLGSAGLVEINDNDGDGDKRVPLVELSDEMRIPFEMMIAVHGDFASAHQAKSLSRIVDRYLRALLPVARIDLRVERELHDPGFQIVADIWFHADARPAFETFVAQTKEGWVRKVDTGWSCDFWWSAARARGQKLVIEEAKDIAVQLTPWSDPTRYPVPADRTADPGLPLNREP